MTHRVEALVRDAFRNLGEWQTSLRAMANQLGQLELRAKRAVAKEVGIKASELRVSARPTDAGDESGDDD